MRKETLKELKTKGWSEQDIAKAEKIIEARKLRDKSRTFDYSTRVLYWTVILVMIIGNFIISFLLVPFLLVFNKLAMDILVVVIGFAFGSLFNLLVLDIKHVSRKYHLIIGIIIPVLALINIAFMVNIANAINEVLLISTIEEGPITISALYVAAFILPYLWSVFVKKRIDIGYKKELTGLEESEKAFEEKY